MIILFADLRTHYAQMPELQVEAFLARNEAGAFTIIQRGDLFHRSDDPEYVLDNLEKRATHVEVEESESLMLTLQPEFATWRLRSDINLPADEFYLLQDVYELPDTGDWSTGQEVAADELPAPPLVACHPLVALHEGTLIDNRTINLLRSRTTYLRVGDRYRRTRNHPFWVRRRTQRVLIVVDNKETRAATELLLSPSPAFEAHFYVLTEHGIPLKELDSGDREHIGLIRHIRETQADPDVILFEPHRESQLRKTETTIIKTKAQINSSFTFRNIRCGTFDIGLTPEAAMQVIHDFIDQEPERVVEEPETSDSIRIRRSTGELNFSYRHLILQFQFVCTQLNIDEAAIGKMLEPVRQQAHQTVFKLVLTKWLPSVVGEERLRTLTQEQRTAAASNYIKRYGDRVKAVTNAIRFEDLMRKTFSLCLRAMKERRRSGSVDLPEMQRESAQRALRRLRELYRNDPPESIGDAELTELYQHDFSKLVTLGLIDTLVERLH
ncbi:MAG: hypothetical protein ACYTGH_01450 [Planctomycetota bacterium]|jgi:hypothetical protein